MPSVRTGISLQRGVYSKVVRDSGFSLKFIAEGTTGNVTSGDISNSVFKHLCANLFTSIKNVMRKKKKKERKYL